MIHLEAWYIHRESLNLSKDKEALLEMLEREIISPEEFVTKWKRMFSGLNREGWLERDEHGRHVMTVDWLAAHKNQVKELLFRKKDTRYLRGEDPTSDRSEQEAHSRFLWYLTQLVLALAPGHYLNSLPGYPSKVFTESGLDAYVEDMLKQAREWDRRLAIYQMEHPTTP